MHSAKLLSNMKPGLRLVACLILLTAIFCGCGRGAITKRAVSTAKHPVETSVEVIERVGTPVTFKSTKCYFGLAGKDRNLVSGMDESQRKLADAIIWVDCNVAGPKGEALVVAWVIPIDEENMALYRLMVADTSDPLAIKKLMFNK